MRGLQVPLLATLILSLASAWECSLKCGRYEYEKCMGEKNQTTDEDENGNVAARHRELESDYAEMSLMQQPKGTHHRLRGRGDTSHRRLMETPDFDFQIKMYWKEGFCWQEEWRERQYCWQCWGGYQGWHDCHDGEMVQINACNASIPSQRWTFTPDDTAADYGRISPSMNTSLCFTGVNATAYRLKPCDATNTKQLFSGWAAKPKFELYPYGQTERCLTQEHDPKIFEQIVAYDCETSRADKTNYWGIYNPNGSYELPNNERAEYIDDGPCVIDLDLMDDLAIRTGAPFISPDHNHVVLEQLQNGNLVVRDQGNIVWQSGINEPLGSYYTRLQGDGNMITYRGEVGEERDRDDIVWRSGRTSSSRYNYFMGLSCEGSYVGIFKGAPDKIQEMIWHDDTTWSSASVLSVADPLVFTPAPSAAPSHFPSETPSVSPSLVPSSKPTFMPTQIPTFYPTPAPWTATPTSIPTAAPWTASPTSTPTTAPSTAPPTTAPTAALSPVPVPSPSPTESSASPYQISLATPGQTCSSNPDCFHLEGDCCPTSDGKFLDCCYYYEPNECKPYSLLLRQRDRPFMNEGSVFRSPEDDTLELEQKDDGNLVIRDGARVIWETKAHNVTGHWYTKLQGTGNLVTYPGVKDVWRGPPIWESGVPRSASWSDSPMFLGLDCTRRYLGVYKGTSDNPGERIWTIPTHE